MYNYRKAPLVFCMELYFKFASELDMITNFLKKDKFYEISVTAV